MMRILLPVFTLLVVLNGSAAADEVQLRSGDRITGSVVRLTGRTLAFKTPHGDLNIQWSDVTTLTVTTTLRVTLLNNDTRTVTAIEAAEPGRVTLNPGGPVALTDIVALGPPEPPFTITGGANAGFLTSSGNTDVDSLRLNLDASLRQGANRYTASASVNRAEDSAVVTAENWTTSLNYDRFLTSRFFLNANGIFTNDRFRDLDLRTALGAGVGYQVLDTSRIRLTANGGLGWVDEDFLTSPDDDYTAVRESAALDVFVVLRRVQLFHKHDGYFGITGEDNLFVKAQNGVRLSVVANFVTTAQLDLDYDRSPAPGRDSTDHTFALTFGYRF